MATKDNLNVGHTASTKAIPCIHIDKFSVQQIDISAPFMGLLFGCYHRVRTAYVCHTKNRVLSYEYSYR